MYNENRPIGRGSLLKPTTVARAVVVGMTLPDAVAALRAEVGDLATQAWPASERHIRRDRDAIMDAAYEVALAVHEIDCQEIREEYGHGNSPCAPGCINRDALAAAFGKALRAP